MAHATSGGASIEPADAPMLKGPPASPRSLAGNHSAVAFIPAGLAQPSANPSNPRRPAKACQVCAGPCADTQFFSQCRSGNRQGAARQIIDNRTKHEQPDDPPAQCFDFEGGHFACDRNDLSQVKDKKEYLWCDKR